MKYEIFDWRADKRAKGLLTKQKIKSIDRNKLQELDLRWFNYENYGKSFLLHIGSYNRLYVVEYSSNVKRDWVKSKLDNKVLFIEKSKVKKKEKHEGQTSLF